jgi:hypothetical protein
MPKLINREDELLQLGKQFFLLWIAVQQQKNNLTQLRILKENFGLIGPFSSPGNEEIAIL